MAKEISNHEKHERHENKKRGEEEPRMHTNAHEWQKKDLTTKHTKTSEQSLVGSKKTQLLEGRGGKDSRVLGYQCSIIIAIKGLCDCFFLVKLLSIYS